jgi:hypothetical protein
MRVSSAHNRPGSAKKLPDQAVDSAHASLRLWIVGILLVLILGGTIVAHFVLPVATCLALWDKLYWPAWALLAFLLGDTPFLAGRKLFFSPGFRAALHLLTKITQENGNPKP